MGFCFEAREPVADGIRRIVEEQLDDATSALRDGMSDRPADAVHECRKCCKRVRAVARVVRPTIGDDRYHAVNDGAREAARQLSQLRDATAIHETFRRTVELSSTPTSTHEPHPPRALVVEQVDGILGARRRAAERELRPGHPAVLRAIELLDDVRVAIADAVAPIDPDAGWEALGPGMKQTYRRARRAMAAAIDDPTGPRFHEWRKRVKYGWHHLQLLEPAAPQLLGARADLAHDISDALGDAHDLVVISSWLTGDDPVVARLPDRVPVSALLDGARASLEARAVDAGRRLFAETPRDHVRRLGELWEVWREHGEAASVGDLETVFER